MVKFVEYDGETSNLPTSENHINFRWVGSGILFSVCRIGNAASCHFSSDKSGLRRLREAINHFVEFVFGIFDWCKMVIAKVVKKSVGKMLLDCSFLLLCSVGGVDVYWRCR